MSLFCRRWTTRTGAELHQTDARRRLGQHESNAHSDAKRSGFKSAISRCVIGSSRSHQGCVSGHRRHVRRVRIVLRLFVIFIPHIFTDLLFSLPFRTWRLKDLCYSPSYPSYGTHYIDLVSSHFAGSEQKHRR